ncbi:MAG: hypothetical protein QOE45_2650 [Frankiaceae bacterium]|jgi:hypothetical protein|nr:hypothetical protein [Frankiaceae bacterium]
MTENAGVDHRVAAAEQADEDVPETTDATQAAEDPTRDDRPEVEPYR